MYEGLNMVGHLNSETKLTGVGSRVWGSDWDSSGKDVFLTLLRRGLEEEIQPILIKEGIFIGFFFEIGGTFLEIKDFKIAVRFASKPKILTCSLQIRSEDIFLDQVQFLQLFLEQLRSATLCILERLRTKKLAVNCAEFDEGMKRIFSKIEGYFMEQSRAAN